MGLIAWILFRTTFAGFAYGNVVVEAFIPTHSITISQSMNSREGKCIHKGPRLKNNNERMGSSTAMTISSLVHSHRIVTTICQIRGGTKIDKIIKVNESKSSSLDKDKSSNVLSKKVLLPIGITAAAIASIGIAHRLGYISSLDTIWGSIKRFRSNPQQIFQNVIDSVKNMGPAGLLYFGLIYFAFDVCSIPAIPLAMSAGYLFGFTKAFIVTLAASTTAQSVSYFIGRTVLRSYIEKNILSKNAKLSKIDKAIGKDGFKLLLILRVTPIFALPLVNYVMGATSINYFNYFWGTLFGCMPGLVLFLYTGMVGKELTSMNTNGQPWYVYAVGFGVIIFLLKSLTDVASDIINAIGDDDTTNNVKDKNVTV